MQVLTYKKTAWCRSLTDSLYPIYHERTGHLTDLGTKQTGISVADQSSQIHLIVRPLTLVTGKFLKN